MTGKGISPRRHPKGCRLFFCRSDIRHGLLTYQRSKTDSRRSDKAEMVLRVEPEAADIIGRWKGTAKLLSCCERYADFRSFTKAVNQGLKEVGAMAGVPGLTTYHARHTWATLARNECGISRDDVAEALNHARRGSDRVTDIYIERDFSRVWEATARCSTWLESVTFSPKSNI